MGISLHRLAPLVLLPGLLACKTKPEAAPLVAAAPEADRATAAVPAPNETASGEAPDREALLARVRPLFGTVEAEVTHPDPEVEAARVELGRTLYFDTRLSKNHDLSCNSCHALDAYGVDVRELDGERAPTSRGHQGAFGDRNSPTVFNAFVHVAQFWDGRAEDVEAQAKGPVLNPVEMALPSPDFAEKVLRSIPGYVKMFARAFPGETEPVSYDNFARAVGAFERKLVTPAPVDRFLQGELAALTDPQARGFALFADRCAACHMGEGFGGAIYQKLGLLKPFETEDEGRFAVTQAESDRKMFKVPSLRNITETGPYLHDGSVASLDEMIQIMAEHQTPDGRLSDAELADLRAFLDALTGALPEALVTPPELPPSGPETPGPNAS